MRNRNLLCLWLFCFMIYFSRSISSTPMTSALTFELETLQSVSPTCTTHLSSRPTLYMTVVVQLLNHVWLFVTSWTVAPQASLSFTISQSLLRFISTELVMLSNHLILCCPLLFLPWILPSIRVFSNELALCIRWPKYWNFSFSISLYLWLTPHIRLTGSTCLEPNPSFFLRPVLFLSHWPPSPSTY